VTALDKKARRLKLLAIVAVVLAALAPLVLLSCSAESSKPVPPVAGGVWSPPGAVASFLVEPGAPIPPREYNGKPWKEIRATQGHRTHGGSERVFCKDCHTKGFVAPKEIACGREGCHVAQAAQPHGAVGGTGDKGCAQCHAFAPGKPERKCIECHDKPQDRASGKLAAVVDGHAKAECSKCHKPHEAKVTAPAECKSCHEKQESAVHAQHAGNSKGCSDCHAPHTPAAAARETCATCHSEPKGPHPAHHASCLSCHDPHAAGKISSNVCTTCHKARVTLRARTVAKHAQCTNCHAGHAPNEVGDASCKKCHVNARVEHPARQGTGAAGGPPPRACAACHTPHPSDPDQKVAHCTSCHAKVATQDQGVHASTLACTGCHKPHDFKAPAKATMRTFCARCHANEATLTAAPRKGHADCTSCHVSAHVKSAPPECSSCHAQQLASATKAHQSCKTCHEPHGGAQRSKELCVSCHAERATGPHRKIDGGCSKCHRAHGPAGIATPPACGTCHLAATRKSLHTVAGHADCTKCHSAHQGPRASRDTCTASGCHTTRKTHEPNAEKCTGCHMFK
jgi:hypothetical protein